MATSGERDLPAGRKVSCLCFGHSTAAALLISVMAFSSCGVSAAGIGLDRTRLIFSGGKKAVALGVRNSSDNAWLVQGRVLTAQGEVDADMVVTPPLFRLERQGDNKIRILATRNDEAHFPSDRESLRYMEISAVPSSSSRAEEAGGQLAVAVSLRIKMFWRPTTLPEPDKHAFRQLTWSRSTAGLRVCNATPYYQSFNTLSFDGKAVDLNRAPSMVAPKGCETYKGQADVRKVSWSVINDYGGDSGVADAGVGDMPAVNGK